MDSLFTSILCPFHGKVQVLKMLNSMLQPTIFLVFFYYQMKKSIPLLRLLITINENVFIKYLRLEKVVRRFLQSILN